MKSLLIAFFALTAGVAAGLLPAVLDRGTEPVRLAEDTELSSFAPQLLPDAIQGDFDLLCRVTPPDSPQTGAVRIFWDVHQVETDQGPQRNYLCFELSADEVRCIRVENNVMKELRRINTDTLGPDWTVPNTIRLRRRTPYADLICDGSRVMRILDDGFPGGQVGTGANHSKITLPSVQPVVNLVFTDDFMRGAEDAGAWVASSGCTWEVRSMDNPARSSNAFVYQGAGKQGGISVVGRPYWDAYRAEVSALGTESGEFGLVLAASEVPEQGELPPRFAFIRWTSTDKGKTSNDESESGGRIEICLVENKETTILAERPGGYRPGQWYRLRADLRDCELSVLVDGRELLSAKHPKLSGGCAGLFMKSAKPVEFDDFRVLSLEEESGAAGSDIRWQFLSGQWDRTGDTLQATAGTATALAVTGRPTWNNVRAETTLEAIPSPVGIVAAFRDPGHYVTCLIQPDGSAALQRMTDGKPTTLDTTEAGTFAPGKTVTLSVDRGHVRCGPLNAFLPDLETGQVGLAVRSHARGSTTSEAVRISRFSATAIDPPLPVVSINEVFDEEQLMKVWSGVAGDWQAFAKSNKPGGYEQAYWHRARFHGETELEAMLPEERADKTELALSICKPVDSEEKNNGYVLFLNETPDAATLKLVRQGEEVAATELDQGALVRRVRLRACGPFVVASINDRPVLHWRDADPLRGEKVAWAEKGIKLPPEQVQVYSHSLISESFNSAPSDWRRAGGVWQVTNRWECDPRWSFMAGMPPVLARLRAEALQEKVTDQAKWALDALLEQMSLVEDKDSKLAALWHKREFDGDFVAECYLAQMMDQSRGGGNYKQYVQNFCMTVAGDGKSLNSGYACIFGGDENERSMIVRDGKVVASSRATIPARDNIHRKWFRMRVERRGKTIYFRAYTQDHPSRPEKLLVNMAYEDPDPLPGKRIAVWTYNNGILLSRVRLAAETIGPMEDPLAQYPAEAECYYTAEKE